jgi:hypothetical protein
MRCPLSGAKALPRSGRTLIGHLEDILELPDQGIWEVRGGRRQFTFSKVMAWVAQRHCHVRLVPHPTHALQQKHKLSTIRLFEWTLQSAGAAAVDRFWLKGLAPDVRSPATLPVRFEVAAQRGLF